MSIFSPSPKDDSGSVNIFSNDGSFMNQFKALLEKQKQDKQEKEDQEKQQSDEEVKPSVNEVKEVPQNDNEHDFDREHLGQNNDERRKSGDRGQR